MRRLVLLLALCAGPSWAEEAGSRTAEVLFQSCKDEGYGPYCVFVGGGRVYETVEDFGTDPALLAGLAALAANTTLRITGVPIVPEDGMQQTLLRLTAVEPGAPDPWADLRAQLQGDWVWTDESTYGLRVAGSEWISLFEGEEVDMIYLHLSETCPQDTVAAEGKPIVILRSGKFLDDPEACIRIDEIGDDHMQVFDASRGITAEWRRP
ncbi:MAG TPA: hypothetical protein PKD10_16675 [Paracoccaceae bacterium]|nr:hypothetical protein [Paracoccaceae bacterium]HMO70569.1 hypothetical protein [Paracoccaceae bacterium]